MSTFAFYGLVLLLLVADSIKVAQVDARDVRRLERSTVASVSGSHSRRRLTTTAGEPDASFRMVGSSRHGENRHSNNEHNAKFSETPLVRLKRVRRDGESKENVIRNAARSPTVLEARDDSERNAPPHAAAAAAAASLAHVNKRQQLQHHPVTDLSKAAVGETTWKHSLDKIEDDPKPQVSGERGDIQDGQFSPKKIGYGKQKGKGQRTGKGDMAPAVGVDQKALIEKIKTYQANSHRDGKQTKLAGKTQQPLVRSQLDGIPPPLTLPSSSSGAEGKHRPNLAERQKQRKQKQHQGTDGNGLARGKSPVAPAGVGEDRPRGGKSHGRRAQQARDWKPAVGLRPRAKMSSADGSSRRIHGNSSPKTVEDRRLQSKLHASSHAMSEPISNRKGPVMIANNKNDDDKRTKRYRKKRRMPSPEVDPFVISIADQTLRAGNSMTPTFRGMSRNGMFSSGRRRHLEPNGGRSVAKLSPTSGQRMNHRGSTVGLSAGNRHRQPTSRQSTAKKTENRAKTKRSIQANSSYRYRNAKSYGHRVNKI